MLRPKKKSKNAKADTSGVDENDVIVVPAWQLELSRVLFSIFCILVITSDLMYVFIK